MTSAKPSAADSWPKAINRRIARFWAATLYRNRLPFGLPDPMLRAVTRASLEGAEVGAHHLTRFAMYKALAGALAAHDAPGRRCLGVSSSSRLVRLLGLKSVRIVAANYPDHSLLDLKFRDAMFDFCVSDQVLEHVAGDPFQAVRESFRVVGPGGFVVHTTCFMNPVHGYPMDFWRFSPDAVALLCESAGGAVVAVGGWGNRKAMRLVMSGLRGIRVPLDERHPVHRIAVENDPSWPIHTWVIARKEG
jgi:SAM-dependent methyltransferase